MKPTLTTLRSYSVLTLRPESLSQYAGAATRPRKARIHFMGSVFVEIDTSDDAERFIAEGYAI